MLNVSDNFLKDLVSNALPSSTFINAVPFYFVGVNLNEFVNDSKFIYYGVFNIGSTGSLTARWIGKSISFTAGMPFNSILADNINGTLFTFVGYQIEIANGIAKIY